MYCQQLYAIGTDTLPGVSGHTTVVHNDRLVIFGGYTGENRISKLFLCNDIRASCFSFEAQAEQTQITEESIPAAFAGRAGHVAQVVNDKILVFGGYDSARRNLSDIFSIDVDTLVPTEIKPKFIPTGLERRWSSGWNNRAETVLFVFGGWGDSGPKNDIVTFDGSSWNTVKATGDVPSPRRWHASLRLQDQDVALTYGGYNGTHLGGMHLFDIETGSWKLVKPTGSLNPGNRCRHTMVQVDNKRLLLLGGFQKESDSSPVQEALIFHLDNHKWEVADIDDTWPLRRAGNTMSTIYNSAGNRLGFLSVGGIDGLGKVATDWGEPSTPKDELLPSRYW